MQTENLSGSTPDYEFSFHFDERWKVYCLIVSEIGSPYIWYGRFAFAKEQLEGEYEATKLCLEQYPESILKDCFRVHCPQLEQEEVWLC